jgi:gamma-glutamyltranspeptidase / glutathione hydrolase
MKSHRMVTLAATATLALASAVPAATAFAAFPEPLRVARSKGVAATANAEASKAAAEILRAGGNAVDAAVAAALALGVTNFESSGLGGAGFALVWNGAEHKARVLDFRETAPAAATRDLFVRDGKVDALASKWGGRAVAVPGEPAGLAELEHKYGKLGLVRVAQPAIKLARDGFVVTRHIVESMHRKMPDGSTMPRLAPDEPLAQLLTPNGREIEVGQIIKRPALARTLEKFAKGGAAAFYRGAVAQAFVDKARRTGGILTVDDLVAYKPIWKEPLQGHFRGRELWAVPPPAGGVTAIEALQILDAREPLEKDQLGASLAWQRIVEALKHAFADRARLLGDPAFTNVPVDKLISPDYAATLAAHVLDDRVQPPADYGDKSLAAADAAHDHGTSHVCIVDGEGNAVSLTTTVNLLFGARMIAGDTGVVMNDGMDDFSAQPGVPNAFKLIGTFANSIAPGKRPASSMTPMLVTHEGDLELCVGAAGGPRILSATVQTIVNVIDYGLDVAAAIDEPRIHAQWLPDAEFFEAFVPRDVVEALEKRGQHLKPDTDRAAVQAISVGADKLEAACDPRYGGAPAAP